MKRNPWPTEEHNQLSAISPAGSMLQALFERRKCFFGQRTKRQTKRGAPIRFL